MPFPFRLSRAFMGPAMQQLEAMNSVSPGPLTFEVRPIAIDWHRDLSIYASEKFLKAVGDEYGWLGGFDESGSIRFILPFTIIRKPFFRFVRFRVETISTNGAYLAGEERSF